MHIYLILKKFLILNSYLSYHKVLKIKMESSTNICTPGKNNFIMASKVYLNIKRTYLIYLRRSYYN